MNSLSSKNVFSRLGKAAIILIPSIVVVLVAVVVYPEHAHYLLLALALILIATGSKSLLTYIMASSWHKHPAIITSINEESVDIVHRYAPIKYYYPLISYQYDFDGQNYTSSRVSFEVENIWISAIDNWGMEMPETDKFWSHWQTGDSIDVFINPKRPDQSVLVRDLNSKRKSHYLAYVVAGIIIGVAWLLIV